MEGGWEKSRQGERKRETERAIEAERQRAFYWLRQETGHCHHWNHIPALLHTASLFIACRKGRGFLGWTQKHHYLGLLCFGLSHHFGERLRVYIQEAGSL